MSHRFGTIGCPVPFPLILLCPVTSCRVCCLFKVKQSFTQMLIDLNTSIIFLCFRVILRHSSCWYRQKGKSWSCCWRKMSECSSESLKQRKLDIYYVNRSQKPNRTLPAMAGWSHIHKKRGSRMGLGYNILYSGREKIICPLVIEFFYGWVSLKHQEMKADKE